MFIADCPNVQQLCLGGGGARVVAVARASGTQREGGGQRKARGAGDAMRTQEGRGEMEQNGRC